VTPPGWTSNPSAWRERLPIIGLAALGAAIAAYLASYQLRVVQDVWEPFFGDGSRTILDSPVSTVLPIPDAALGLLDYVADAVTGVKRRRGRLADRGAVRARLRHHGHRTQHRRRHRARGVRPHPRPHDAAVRRRLAGAAALVAPMTRLHDGR
jgi:hypothetical protein